MARISGQEAGLVVKPIPKRSPAKKKKIGEHRCQYCGYTFAGTMYQLNKRFYKLDFDGEQDKSICMGCMRFFQIAEVFLQFRLPELPEDVIKRIEEIKEAQYVLIEKTMRFGSEKTGRLYELDFGDIFKCSRIGSDIKSDGTYQTIKQIFTVDVMLIDEPVTLFTREVIPISWVEIMLLRQDKLYSEAFLSPDDKEGHFKPTDLGKEVLLGNFGNR